MFVYVFAKKLTHISLAIVLVPGPQESVDKLSVNCEKQEVKDGVP